jgi:hypothetical protein
MDEPQQPVVIAKDRLPERAEPRTNRQKFVERTYEDMESAVNKDEAFSTQSFVTMAS